MLKRYINFFTVALLVCSVGANAAELSLRAGDADAKSLHDITIVASDLARVEDELVWWCAERSPAEKELETRKNELVSRKFELLELRLTTMEDEQTSLMDLVGNLQTRCDCFSQKSVLVESAAREVLANQKRMTALPAKMEEMCEGAYRHADEYVGRVAGFQKQQLEELRSLKRTVSTLTTVFLHNKSQVRVIDWRNNGMDYGIMSWKGAHELATKNACGLRAFALVNGTWSCKMVKREKNDEKADYGAGEKEIEVCAIDDTSLGMMPEGKALKLALSQNCDLVNCGKDGVFANRFKLVPKDKKRGSTIGIDRNPKATPTKDKPLHNAGAAKPGQVDEGNEDEDPQDSGDETSSADDEHSASARNDGVSHKKKSNGAGDGGTQLLSASADGNDKPDFEDEDLDNVLPAAQVLEQTTNAINKQTGKNVKFNLPNSPST